jgi:hypothetical protein
VQLQQLYRVETPGQGSELFGIIGNPVSHSKSLNDHSSACKRLEGELVAAFDSCLLVSGGVSRDYLSYRRRQVLIHVQPSATRGPSSMLRELLSNS